MSAANESSSNSTPQSESACPVDHNTRSRWKKWFGGNPHQLQQDTKNNPMLIPHASTSAPTDKKSNNISGKDSCVSNSDLVAENLMYAENQKPHPKQKNALDTDRITASIPRATQDNSDVNWVYPSPQMFYNAMDKKGYEPKEEDMNVVVSIHNDVNERTWRQLLGWEMVRASSQDIKQPKLVKFSGRPDDLTPRARLRTLFGYPKPFDRHDWIVERNGQQVRYVIDYYAYQEKQGDAPVTLVDCRPALDSLDAVLDRTKVWFSSKFGIGPQFNYNVVEYQRMHNANNAKK